MNDLDFRVSNIIETVCTVLSSINVSPELVDGNTELWYDDETSPIKVGYIAVCNDVVTGCERLTGYVNPKNSNSYTGYVVLETLNDINKYKEMIMSEFNITDGSALPITVQYQHDDTVRMGLIEKGDWIDMYADEDVEMKSGEFKLIHLGVAMKLPDGYEGHLAPRGSTFKKWHIIQANSVGVVDNSYCGPNDWWRFPAIALADTKISRGDKICQFRIVEKQPNVRFVEGKMTSEDRGGFGSTGTK